MAAATESTTTEELKRLGFVYEYGALATDTFAKFYDLAKKQAPSSLTPGIETIETSIMSYGTPIVGKAKEVAPKILTAADKRIDAVVGQATENVNSFKKGREEYLTKIEKLIEEIKTLKFMSSFSDVQAKLVEKVNELWGMM